MVPRQGDYVVAGITSWGEGCADPALPRRLHADRCRRPSTSGFATASRPRRSPSCPRPRSPATRSRSARRERSPRASQGRPRRPGTSTTTAPSTMRPARPRASRPRRRARYVIRVQQAYPDGDRALGRALVTVGSPAPPQLPPAVRGVEPPPPPPPPPAAAAATARRRAARGAAAAAAAAASSATAAAPTPAATGRRAAARPARQPAEPRARHQPARRALEHPACAAPRPATSRRRCASAPGRREASGSRDRGAACGSDRAPRASARAGRPASTIRLTRATTRSCAAPAAGASRCA